MTLPRLTRREVQVFSRIASGEKNSAIGAALKISPHTVRTHVRNVFSKFAASGLRVNSRIAIVVLFAVQSPARRQLKF